MNKVSSFTIWPALAFLLMIMNLKPVLSQVKKLPEQVQIQVDNYKNNAIKNRNLGNDNAAASYLNKIAFLYWEYYMYEKAIQHFEEVLVINERIGNDIGLQKVHDNMGFVYSDMGRDDKSIHCFDQSLKFIEKKGDKEQVATGLSNLALSYSNNGQYEKSIEIAQKGLEISKAISNTKLTRSFYGIIYESYDKLGNKDKSVKYFGLYSAMDKHIQQQLFNEREQQNKKQLSKMKQQKDKAVQDKVMTEEELTKTQDTLKEVEQISRERQMAIDLLNKEKEIKDLTIKQHEAKLKAERRLTYFLSAIFIFVCAFAILIFRQMQEKKKANSKLQELYKEIEKKNIQILDSINYASHIQEAILPYEKLLKEDIENAFIMFKPRDIVSGDFYWHSRFEDKVFIAAIDCTGHGVPGAFMSMIGNTLLNEIVNEKQVHNPAEVLQQLNDKVIDTLNQGNPDQEGFSEDGMDISFCCYSKKDNTLELALANHSSCIFQNNEAQILEGDIFSVGGNVGFDNIGFTNYKIDLNVETTIYMFSDGFQDQFGGEKHQKYMATKFVNYLSSLQEKEFSDHQKLLEGEFLRWKGDHRQIDDVLVIGLRFNS